MAGSDETVGMSNGGGVASRVILAGAAIVAIVASAGTFVNAVLVVFAIMDASDAGHVTGGGEAALAVGAPVVAIFQLLCGIGLIVLWARRSPRRKSSDRMSGTILVGLILIVVSSALSAALIVTQPVIDHRERAYDLASVHVLQAWIAVPGVILLAVGIWLVVLWRASRRRGSSSPKR